MFTETDMIKSVTGEAFHMAVTTLHDIYKHSDGDALTSDELEDVALCLDIIKDSCSIKDTHADSTKMALAEACKNL